MVKDASFYGIDPAAGHPERLLALGYTPSGAEAGVSALFALDATLARLALGTRDVMVAQLRLTWWYEALGRFGVAVPPAQPILQTLASAGADGTALAPMAAGWERLLDTPSDEDLLAFAADRATVFTESARLAEAADDVRDAGSGWALADLARTTSDPALSRRAAALAAPMLDRAAAQKWSASARFLGALIHVARADLAGEHAIGAPRRVARLVWHRMTGR